MELLQAVAEANLDHLKHPNDIKKHEPAYISMYHSMYHFYQLKETKKAKGLC